MFIEAGLEICLFFMYSKRDKKNKLKILDKSCSFCQASFIHVKHIYKTILSQTILVLLFSCNNS